MHKKRYPAECFEDRVVNSSHRQEQVQGCPKVVAPGLLVALTKRDKICFPPQKMPKLKRVQQVKCQLFFVKILIFGCLSHFVLGICTKNTVVLNWVKSHCGRQRTNHIMFDPVAEEEGWKYPSSVLCHQYFLAFALKNAACNTTDVTSCVADTVERSVHQTMCASVGNVFRATDKKFPVAGTLRD